MKKFRDHFRFAWWQYALVALAAIVLWTGVFDILLKPDANEKVTVSYFGTDLDWQTLESSAQQALPARTDQYLEEITFEYFSDTDGDTFGQTIQTRLFSSDLLIFTEDILTEDFLKNSFPPLPQQLLEGIGEHQVYEVDGMAYGIVLTGSTNHFAACYSGSQRCIAFFGPYSENIAAAYGNGNPQDDAAIALLHYLLEDSNG